jgi:hypothetical protein
MNPTLPGHAHAAVPWPSALLVLPECTIGAAEVNYTLDIAETSLAPAGTPVEALTINAGIPGPVLARNET